jgi:hypothetical protein
MSAHSTHCVTSCVDLGMRRFSSGDGTAVRWPVALSYAMVPDLIEQCNGHINNALRTCLGETTFYAHCLRMITIMCVCSRQLILLTSRNAFGVSVSFDALIVL